MKNKRTSPLSRHLEPKVNNQRRTNTVVSVNERAISITESLRLQEYNLAGFNLNSH